MPTGNRRIRRTSAAHRADKYRHCSNTLPALRPSFANDACIQTARLRFPAGRCNGDGTTAFAHSKGGGQVVHALWTSRFTAVPVGLHGTCGPVSEQQMDRYRGSYTFFRANPTHTDSPRQSGGARKELGVLREWITFSICRPRRYLV